MVFQVYVLRPSDCSGFVATVNGEEVPMIRQNRWPVPEVQWLYPSTNDNSDFTMWEDPVTYRAGAPFSESLILTAVLQSNRLQNDPESNPTGASTAEP
ncbi:unnamed protein product [Urochloa humidicola]